jgi:hypothetical protein
MGESRLMTLSSEDVKLFRSKYGVTVVHANCDPSAAEDKSLPSNSYLVTLHQEDEHWCDIVMGPSSDIFDAYYDSFGNVVKSMGWTHGTRNPKLWGESNKTKSKKK